MSDGTGDLAFFDPPTWLYNVLSFALSIAGVVFGVAFGAWALWIAYWQIGEAVTAARAAHDAAQQARREIRRMSVIMDISKLAQLSGRLHHLIRDKKFHESAGRIQELRTGIAEIQATEIGKSLQTNAEWKKMDGTILQVQNVMDLRESLKHDSETEECMGLIAQIDIKLHAMMAHATNAKELPHGPN